MMWTKQIREFNPGGNRMERCRKGEHSWVRVKTSSTSIRETCMYGCSGWRVMTVPKAMRLVGTMGLILPEVCGIENKKAAAFVEEVGRALEVLAERVKQLEGGA